MRFYEIKSISSFKTIDNCKNIILQEIGLEFYKYGEYTIERIRTIFAAVGWF